LAFGPPVFVAPFGETDIQRSRKAETRLRAARAIWPSAVIAQQDRASLRGPEGPPGGATGAGRVRRRRRHPTGDTDDPPKRFAMERSHATAPRRLLLVNKGWEKAGVS